MNLNTQNDLLLNKLMQFYNLNDNLDKALNIINGKSSISLRIVDWFATNFSKENYTQYPVSKNGSMERFKVYNDYKLNLKAYSKKRFDPFCRWDRITIPYKNGTHIQTTIGQLNFFKWALENSVIQYIEDNYTIIDNDMNTRNSTTKSKKFSINSSSSEETVSSSDTTITNNFNKTRKKREELSYNASKGVKKESIEVVMSF
jgi:hypothetical protein|tara:strand:+ start:1948 stop:2553 length:606 start_codon:yes stop_codon:yes gene_type:complete